MVSSSRHSPGSRSVARTDRLVQENDKWFVHTLEGTLEGPFDSDIQALNQLIQYVKSLNSRT